MRLLEMVLTRLFPLEPMDSTVKQLGRLTWE